MRSLLGMRFSETEKSATNIFVINKKLLKKRLPLSRDTLVEKIMLISPVLPAIHCMNEMIQ